MNNEGISEKQALIITCFYNYSFNTRLVYVIDVLESLGYKCTIVTSDFDHRNKKQYVLDKINIEQVHVTEYHKNISIKRLLSHNEFARKAVRLAQSKNPDLIYVGSPPNSCISVFKKYKNDNPSTKLILSITDMWPETMPIPPKYKLLLSPALSIWSNMRNKNIRQYNGVIFECDLFRNYLRKYIHGIYSKTVYLSKKDTISIASKHINREYNPNCEIKLAYVGSVNNIIDLGLIAYIVEQLSKFRRVSLSIIGNGEKMRELKNKITDLGVEVTDYGIVYDDDEKYKILSLHHYGLNIMKDTVFVGATMKSLEYLYFGLPMLNSISGDTHKIVEDNNCGFNINMNTPDYIFKRIAGLNSEEYYAMVKSSQDVFGRFFSEDSVHASLYSFFAHIENGEIRN